MSNNEPKYSFEEFKLIYESTEKVTDRRLEANRWNYTVCIGVLLAIAGIMNYSINNIPFFYIGLISIIVLTTFIVARVGTTIHQAQGDVHYYNDLQQYEELVIKALTENKSREMR